MARIAVPKLALVAALASLAAASAALTVSVAPSEGAAFAPPPDGSGSPMAIFVTGCMDRLFDAGFIVTDSSALRVPRSSWAQAAGPMAGVLSEAREGLVDYVISLYVDWTPSSYRKSVLMPSSIGYRLLRAADGKVVYEGESPAPKDSEEASSHIEQTVSQAGSQAALACVELLKTLAMGGE